MITEFYWVSNKIRPLRSCTDLGFYRIDFGVLGFYLVFYRDGLALIGDYRVLLGFEQDSTEMMVVFIRFFFEARLFE